VLLGALVLGLGPACQGDAEAALARGNAAARDGRLDEARARFAEAIAAQPRGARAHALAGNAAHALGRGAEAAAAWARALELEPGQPMAALGLAQLALEAGDAGACLDRLSAVPAAEAARLTRARALLLRGAAGDAATVLSELEGATSPDAAFLRASALLALGRFADAQAAFEALALRAPALGSYGLARVAATQGRATDALLHLTAARRAAGAAWRPASVAADPAFDFLSDNGDFRALTSD
jgi:tetratricopeptide (TPR) repeat protein